MKKIFISFLVLLTFSCNSKKNTTPVEQKIDPDKTQLVPINNESHKQEIETPIKKGSNIDSVNIEIKEKNTTKIANEETTKKTTKVVNTQKNTASKTKTFTEKQKIETQVVKKVTEKKVNQVIISSKPNHDLWNTLTKANVSSNGKVNYKGFKKSLTQLSNYLKLLEQTPPQKDWQKNEKLAYWFNLYNASTVHLVASNYPVKSIKDINNGKPWDKKFIKSGNKTYSLNDIENIIVRPHFNEPRLHVAFNCAAASCPILFNEAFEAHKLNSQLNYLAKKWINDTTKNQISENNIAISQIFNWYKTDFKKGVIPFLNTYSTTTKINPKATITYLEYNWKLNE